MVPNKHTRKSLLKKFVLVFANLTRWPGNNWANVPTATSVCTTCAYARPNFLSEPGFGSLTLDVILVDRRNGREIILDRF